MEDAVVRYWPGLWATVFAGVLALLSHAAVSDAQGGVTRFVYQERTGEKAVDFHYELTRENNQVVITSREPEKRFRTVCSSDGQTSHWVYRNNGHGKVTAWKSGDLLHIFGRVDGNIVEKSIELEGYPWYQPLSYSLRTLVLGEDGRRKFWFVRPDTMEVVLLSASKRECEPEPETVEPVDACRVEVRKSGLPAIIWRASYWFRASDGTFLRYRSVHGPPGTAPTTIKMVNEQSVARSTGR